MVNVVTKLNEVLTVIFIDSVIRLINCLIVIYLLAVSLRSFANKC